MSVNTISNFIAAVDAVTAKSGATYYCATQSIDGDLDIFRVLNGVTAIFAHVFYSANPDWGVATDVNTTGAGVIIWNKRLGQTIWPSDQPRYCDAQQFINFLAAN